MRIVLGKIDAVPARGGFMAIKVQANTGELYEVRVDPEHTSRFAEAIARVRAGWNQAPEVEAPPAEAPPRAAPMPAAKPAPPRRGYRFEPPRGSGAGCPNA